MPMARVNNQGGVGDPVGPDVRPKSPKDTEMHVSAIWINVVEPVCEVN